LPEAVGKLRETRRQPHTGALVSLSAADPLNLIGILTPGRRVPALTGNRVLYRDGTPIAAQEAGQPLFLCEVEPADHWMLKNALAGRAPTSSDTAAAPFGGQADSPAPGNESSAPAD